MVSRSEAVCVVPHSGTVWLRQTVPHGLSRTAIWSV